MTLRRTSQFKRCLECLVHKDNCYCDQIRPLDLKTRVGLIMYKKERWLPSNTAMLSQKSLSNSALFLRGVAHEPLPPRFLEEDTYQPLYLYPDDDAHELTNDYLSAFKKPIHLIVPDGTWRQAKKIHAREKALSHLPKVKLSSTPKSIYPLRRQKFDGGVCTHEAIAYALGIIEGHVVQEKMMNNLEVMIRAHLIYRPIFEKQKTHKGRTIKT